MTELSRQVNCERLAAWEIALMGGPPEDIAMTADNLRVAQSLDQLVLDVDGDRCTGFVAYLRLTPDQLLDVAATKRRVFAPGDNTPDGEVCFWMEQVNTAGRPAMLRRMRAMSALPHVEAIAGWRGTRLRIHKVVH